jgi:hypothetical protein
MVVAVVNRPYDGGGYGKQTVLRHLAGRAPEDVFPSLPRKVGRRTRPAATAGLARPQQLPSEGFVSARRDAKRVRRPRRRILIEGDMRKGARHDQQRVQKGGLRLGIAKFRQGFLNTGQRLPGKERRRANWRPGRPSTRIVSSLPAAENLHSSGLVRRGK